MFLLVPAYPGCPGQTAVKWLLLLLSLCLMQLLDTDSRQVDWLMSGRV